MTHRLLTLGVSTNDIPPWVVNWIPDPNPQLRNRISIFTGLTFNWLCHNQPVTASKTLAREYRQGSGKSSIRRYSWVSLAYWWQPSPNSWTGQGVTYRCWIASSKGSTLAVMLKILSPSTTLCAWTGRKEDNYSKQFFKSPHCQGSGTDHSQTGKIGVEYRASWQNIQQFKTI